MTLGNRLFHARKSVGLSQEDVAEKLGVSRQTVSKWETDETLPDIRQAKQMAVFYRVTLDELIEFDPEVQEIEQMIERTSEELQEKIDWNQMWGKKYPILVKYQTEVNIPYYAAKLELLLRQLREEYHYNELDAMLVLKDILAQVWNRRKKDCQ